MAQATETQRNKATSRAAAAVICVIAFACVFAFCMHLLVGSMPGRNTADDRVAVTGGVRTEPFYVLLIGSDSRRGTALYTGQAKDGSQLSSYADIMTLMRVDPAAYTITLLTVPRDTVIDPDGPKVNSALLSDNPEDVVKAVAELTGVRADYYMMTTFITFTNLINALGGLDIDVPKDITVDDPSTGKMITVKAGKNRHLNGSEALALARARHEYGDDQEAKRQNNVRSIEAAIVRKVLDMDGSLDIEHILATLEHDTYTNIDLASMGGTIIDFVAHADLVQIFEGTGLYEGTTRKSDNEWVIYGDEETWTRLMELVDAGGDPEHFIEPPKI